MVRQSKNIGHGPTILLTWWGVTAGIRRLLPLAVFALLFGLAFGAAAVERGLAASSAVLMSATVFAGASQFAALDLWHEPIPYLSLGLVVLAVNARHIVLGAALAPWLGPLPRLKRLGSLAVMSDVNFAISLSAFRNGERDAGILVGGGLLLWSAWVSGTAIGALSGAWIGSLDRFGVDVVMAAFFMAIVAGGASDRPDILPGLMPILVAAAVAIATLPLLPSGWNVIAAALCGGLTGLRCHVQ